MPELRRGDKLIFAFPDAKVDSADRNFAVKHLKVNETYTVSDYFEDGFVAIFEKPGALLPLAFFEKMEKA